MTAAAPAPSAASAPPSAPPAAAPALRRVAAQVLVEARTVLRNGEQLILTLVLPVLLLVVLARTTLVDIGVDDDRIGVVAPGVLALAVMSTAFTSQAITTGFDRRNGVLRHLATTPLGRSGLLAGKAGAVLLLQVGQMAVLVAVAVALGWRPAAAGVPGALGVLLLGTAAFTSLALLIAGVLRAEAVIAVANLVWVLLLAGGAVLLPADVLPGPLAAIAPALPSGALGEGLRAALAGDGVPATSLLVLAVWTAAAAALTARTFRWS